MADTIVKVSFVGDARDLKKTVDEVDGKVGGLTNKFGGLAKAGALVASGATVAFLGASAKAFAEDEKAAAALAQTLHTTVGATDEQVKSVEKFINKTQNATGVLDDELRPALGELVRGTGDLTKAQKLLGLAMDISAGTGKDLGSVTEALSKAANGNFKALKALDPALNDLIKDGASTDEIMGALAQTFEGQTAIAADTTSGKLAIAKARFSDLQEEIGAKVVPILAALAEFLSTKVIPAIESIVHWLEEHKGVAIALGVAIGTVLVAAFIAWAAAAIAAAAATIAAAAPVIAITVAIAALAAGIIYAYTHWGWFRAAVDAVADAVQWLWNNVIQPFADWISKDFVDKLEFAARVGLGAMTLGLSELVLAVWRHWDQIVDFVTGLPGRITDAARGMWDGIWEAFRSMINKVIDAWNSLDFKLPEVSAFGVHIGGQTFGVPDIPHLAQGGIVNRPTIALLGENGPEAVIPLRGRGTGTTLNFNFHGPVGSKREMQEWVAEAVAGAQRRGII